MRSSALKSSLINRIIVVSRKPRGLVTNRSRRKECSVLPAASAEVVSNAVDLLTSQPWPRHCVWHAVSSMAASQCLHVISQYQLARLCELGKQEETGESSMAVRGEGEGVRELEDRDGSGGLRDRVVCLSALIPVMAAYASLHPMVHSALREVIISGVGLSPECEQSLLHTCVDDPEKLVDLTKLARSHGHHFSRLYYRGALCMVLEQTSSSTENDGDSPPQEMHAVAGELLAMMSGDWDKRVLEAEVFWLALHLARDESQVQAICEDMHTSEYLSDESVSDELVRACLRTAPKRNHTNPRHRQADPSHAVSTLVSHLPSKQASVSATAFEKVLIACADTLQMRKAYETFTCMTLTHGLAPTRAGMWGLGTLLCNPAFSAKHQWRRFRLAFAFHMLEASVDVFGGVAPGWVYAVCARPFTELLGTRGYQLTHDLCQAAVIREHGDDATVVMSELWGRELYHALLESCRVNHGPELATFLLNHMTQRGIPPNERTFRHLLKYTVSRSNIDNYIAVLARHLRGLSSEEIANLEQPLRSVLSSTVPDTVSDSVSDVVVDSTVEQLLETVSTHSTEDHCIAHLASLSGVSLPSELSASTTLKDNSRDYDHAHVHRATA